MVAATPPTAAILKKSLRDVCIRDPPTFKKRQKLFLIASNIRLSRTMKGRIEVAAASREHIQHLFSARAPEFAGVVLGTDRKLAETSSDGFASAFFGSPSRKPREA